MPDLLILPVRRFSPERYRPGGLGNWSGHLPFAADLIDDLRPERFVELGTHFGESYFGFCQAVQETGVPTRCTAVDTWRGDEHAGFYDDEVYREVEDYNASHYGSFSTLLRASFDEACDTFAEESIDLLHIDGLHTYDAVKHDFDRWLPKVAPGGIVLLHDIDIVRTGFEVWQLWEELTRKYDHFSFRHNWGLGLIRKPGATAPPILLHTLLKADQTETEQIRHQYEDAAELLEARQRVPAEAQEPRQNCEDARLRLTSEDESRFSLLRGGEWKKHLFTLPQGAPSGLVQIGPIDRPAMIEIFCLTLRNGDGEPADGMEHLLFAHNLIPVGPMYFSFGRFPELVVEVPPSHVSCPPLHVEILMKVQYEFGELHPEFEKMDQARKDSAEAVDRAERLRSQLLELHEQYLHMTQHAIELRAEADFQRKRADAVEHSLGWQLTRLFRKS